MTSSTMRTYLITAELDAECRDDIYERLEEIDKDDQLYIISVKDITEDK